MPRGHIPSVCLLLFLCIVAALSWKDTVAQLDEKFDSYFGNLDTVDGLNQGQTMRLLDAVLTGIERALKFLHKHVNQINLDGLIGPREVEGGINALLIRYWPRMPSSLVSRLIRLRQSAYAVGEEGNRVVSELTPFYYSRVYHLIQSYSWSMYRPPDQLNYSLAWTQYGKRDAWDERHCDDCMHEFLNKTKDGRCNLSRECWSIVTSDVQNSYSLVHQVIYILVGINSGCLDDMEQLFRYTPWISSVTELLRTLCTRIFIEAEDLAAADFPLEYRDLFMEQIGICGEAGFVDPPKLSWIPLILSWQAPTGCFYQFPNENMDAANFEPKRYGTYRRRKRAEKYMTTTNTPYICLSHRTSVALSALRSFLVRLIESIYGRGHLFQNHVIDFANLLF